MSIWEVDIYRRPRQDAAGNPLWELVVCDAAGELLLERLAPQSQVNAAWVQAELETLGEAVGLRPQAIHCFRPQSCNLLEVVCQQLKLPLVATRQTPALKALLKERWQPTNGDYDPIALDRPAPVPMPEKLWGDRWRFGALAAGDLEMAFRDRPVPVLQLPEEFLPLGLGLASTLLIPGVVIEGGRQAMKLAGWLESVQPSSLHFIPGAPDGLILEAGLVDRWVLATTEDSEVRSAGQTFEQRKRASLGVHFLLVQPDDSGMTFSGFWLLRER